MHTSLESFVTFLETYRGRDKVMRTLCYGSQLVGGVLSQRSTDTSQLGKTLLLLSAQMSHCRVVLRLFDDLSMAAYSSSYGLGAKEQDRLLRWMAVLNNMADQLYYPCEHIAWAADAGLIKARSDGWWTISTVLWATSLLLGILRSLRMIVMLRRKVKVCREMGHAEGRESAASIRRELCKQIQREMLSGLSSTADLCNAVHWMPPGVLWAGLFPHWLVGLLGTTSSVIGLLQMSCSEQGSSS